MRGAGWSAAGRASRGYLPGGVKASGERAGCARAGAGLGAWALGTGHGPSWAGALRWGKEERAAGERRRPGPRWAGLGKRFGLGWVLGFVGFSSLFDSKLFYS